MDMLTLDSDLPGLAAIELFHPLDFRKRHEVTIFQPMPRFIETCHHCIFSLRASAVALILWVFLTSSIETTIPF